MWLYWNRQTICWDLFREFCLHVFQLYSLASTHWLPSLCSPVTGWQDVLALRDMEVCVAKVNRITLNLLFLLLQNFQRTRVDSLWETKEDSCGWSVAHLEYFWRAFMSAVWVRNCTYQDWRNTLLGTPVQSSAIQLCHNTSTKPIHILSTLRG